MAVGGPERTIVDFTVGSPNGLAVNADGSINIKGISPAAVANILDAFANITATQAATTILTVPQGRTWKGVITISCTVTVAAASTTQSQAQGLISTAGAGVTPAAGTYFGIDCVAGAQTASGTIGEGAANTGFTPFTVTAPAGNAVQIQLATTNVGTYSRVLVSAIGELI